MAGSNLMNEWLIRVVVLSSFAAHVVLVLFAGIRRREAISWRRPILWLAYRLADWAAKYALANLSLGSTSREQQLVAFWAPFLLLHLGGPDNSSAYSLEDNVLWGREVLNALFQIVGASIVVYKHVYIGGSGTLRWATLIMFIAGVAKYVERALALWQGDLGSIRSSGKKQKPRSFGRYHRGGWELDDEKALLDAHNLFHISKGAFADYSDDKDPHPLKRETRRKPLPLEWWDMRKVVEMELSLMYDILYTKAALIHTWLGYIIRVLSPPFTVAAFLLFLFCSKYGQRRVDVVITYILLAVTFLLDMRWLLRSLASTWTYAFLDARPRCWLHHAFLCTGRWHRLRRVVASMDLGWLLFLRAPSSSYRMWSGTIGQYNLLHECTRGTTSFYRSLVKHVGLEDSWNEYRYSRGLEISADKVEKELFETIWEYLKKAYPVVKKVEEEAEKKKEAEEKKKKEGEEKTKKEEPSADKRRRKLDETLNFDPEFQEVILIWHIATDIFLLCKDQNAASFTYFTYVRAIKALSNYMVFLVSVRPYMLPGLKLQSQHRATRDALDKIWREKGSSSSSRISPGSEENLARILLYMEKKLNTTARSDLYESSVILSDGTKYAEVLLTLLCSQCWEWDTNPKDKSKERLQKIFEELIPALKVKLEWGDKQVLKWKGDMETLLKHILDAWVRLLIYVSVRCSRDSHAKQLSRGGELTTIVWILAEHAGIFGIYK